MKYKSIHFFQTAVVVLLISLVQGCTSTPTQATYASPDDAVTALVNATRSKDQAALHKILGPECDQIISSGDPVADRNMATVFLSDYDRKHQLTPGDNGSMTLLTGDKDWPLPIPIVKDEKKNVWRFDTAAGKEEILNRRIGRNELTTIQVCRALVDAQREYAQRDPDGDGIPEYAQKFFSDPGKKNGLYWKTEEGETPSPLGSLVAAAAVEGYTGDGTSTPAPYHGYCYRLLMSQGPHAAGGACDYIINGQMIGGFAVVAYPADYGNSGVMTFIVNHSGDVYQQDLGSTTAATAQAMSAFDPAPDWQKVEPAQPQE